MYPGYWAAKTPERDAVVLGRGGTRVTYKELDQRSNQLAHYFRDCGLQNGDIVAALLPNDEYFHIVAWGARRAGLLLTPVNWHLTPDEVAYIVNDCGTHVLVASAALGEIASALDSRLIPAVSERLMFGGAAEGWKDGDVTMAPLPTTAIADEAEGSILQYSSGTTGRPKGVVARLKTGGPIQIEADPIVPFLRRLGFEAGDTYLSPAPLYHSAPTYWTMAVHRLGGRVIVMERFDAEEFLYLVQAHHVTHVQAVPTMFVRLLKLPKAVRDRYDVSSLRSVVHAAAPCPEVIKRQMIDWLGPIVYEYWSSTEGAGMTFVDSHEWLEHPGTVGRSVLGTLHVVNDDGEEVPPGTAGSVWAEAGLDFEYLNDPDKTSQSRDSRGWRTVGDMGYLDEDGYLYLTDRKAHMIISGGVNIYPQETENVLITHPKVADVAVIGIPDADIGEQVKAVVQPSKWSDAGPALERELIEFCREKIAGYKCPRSVDFRESLPRTDTGKLYKRRLRDEYLRQDVVGPPAQAQR